MTETVAYRVKVWDRSDRLLVDKVYEARSAPDAIELYRLDTTAPKGGAARLDVRMEAPHA